MKIYIKALDLEVEASRSPYVCNEDLLSSDNSIVIEAVDGRVFIVPHERDFIIEYESQVERKAATRDLDRYYRCCIAYRVRAHEGVDAGRYLSLSDFMDRVPFSTYYANWKANCRG